MSEQRLGLSTWLALLVAGVALPLLVFAAFTVDWLAASYREQRDAAHLHTARALALAVDAEMRVWKAAVEGLSVSNDLRRDRLAAFYEEARQVGATYGGWVLLDDPSTQQLLNTLQPYGEPLPRTSAEIRACYKESGVQILDPYVGVLAQRLIIVVGLPIVREGQTLGCLHLNLRPERLARLFEGQQLPATWVTVIHDRQRRVVARFPHDDARVGQLGPTWLHAITGRTEAGLVDGDLSDGRQARVAFHRLREVPWVLALAVPVSELQAPWRRPLLGFLVAGGLLAVAALVGAVYVGRKIAAPVVALAESSQAVVRGEASGPGVKPTSREVAQLESALIQAGKQAQAYYYERERAAVAEEAARVAAASEQAVRASEAELQTILENADEGLVVAALDGHFIHWNRAAVAMHGFGSAEECRRRLPELAEIFQLSTMDGAILPLEQWPLARILRGEQLREWELRVRRPQGDWERIFSYGGALARTRDGTSLLAVVTVRDVTQRKRTEAALAESNAFLRAILDQAAEEIVVRDAAGRLVLANAAVRRSARAAPEGTGVEQVTAIWGDMLTREGRPIPPEAWPIRRALRGERAQVEFRRAAPDGRERVLLNAATPILGPGGQLMGAVSVSTEITDLTRREAELRGALADKEALLREVHHRVKNNLQMLCDLMYLQMEAIPDRDEHQHLQDAYSRIYAIARLHEQLYQSLQSGQIQLPAYVGRLIGGFEGLYPAVRISLEAPESHLALDVDRAIHVGLIVNELITNAMKHAFPNFQDGRIDVRLHRMGDRLELQVEDNGVGLPVDTDLTQANSLGLRIVRILAHRLEAEVTVSRNGGTRFTLTFPLHADTPVEPRQE